MPWPSLQRNCLLVLVFLTFSEALYIHRQALYAKEVESVYSHPRTEIKKHVVTVQGAIVYKTKTIYMPSGERIVYREASRGPVTSTTDSDKTSQPAPLRDVMNSTRVDRWLLGVDNRNLSPKDWHSYTVYGGYSFNNRLDVMVGVDKSDSTHGHVMLVGRF